MTAKQKTTGLDIRALALVGAKLELEMLRAEFPELFPRIDAARHVMQLSASGAKTHWTQRPENAAKVKAMARKGRRTRLAAREKKE